MFTKNFAQAWVVSLLLVISLTTSTFAAEPKKSDGRIGVGDLVEFTTGMGPMLAYFAESDRSFRVIVTDAGMLDG